VALVALGSYERRELCPGSDVDVLLCTMCAAASASGQGSRRTLLVPAVGCRIVTGHGLRTVKESSLSPTTTSTH
jgi:UTP:GlnB (protein PII) uridylyltransferase